MTEVGGNCLDRLIQRAPCRTITNRVLADTHGMQKHKDLVKMSIKGLFSLQKVPSTIMVSLQFNYDDGDDDIELLRLGTGAMSPTPHRNI